MIGIDIVEVSRIKELIKKQSFVDGVFLKEEYDYFLQKGSNPYTLAGIYAAKEAVLKALGCGISTNLTNIQVLHKTNGQPYLFQNDFVSKYNVDFCLSITHTNDIAIAVCVAQYKDLNHQSY